MLGRGRGSGGGWWWGCYCGFFIINHFSEIIRHFNPCHAGDFVNRLVLDGDFYLSPTILDGRPVLRACILSHATRAEHLDSLVRAVVRIGDELSA